MKSYKKIKTGIRIPVEIFQETPRCVYCGKSGKDPCDECIKKEFKKCEVCRIVLRDEPMIRYYYSSNDRKDYNIDLKKFSLDEYMFIIPVKYKKHSDIICESCIGWQDEVSNLCWKCKEKILDNSLFSYLDMQRLATNYKINGNLCKNCRLSMGVDYLDEEIL